jgi:hypothetical protein
LGTEYSEDVLLRALREDAPRCRYGRLTKMCRLSDDIVTKDAILQFRKEFSHMRRQI